MLPLSSAECLVVAKCALNYPKGRGDYFFSDEDIDTFSEAEERIRSDPESVGLG